MTIVEAIAERLQSGYTDAQGDAYIKILERLAKGYWLQQFVEDAIRESDLTADPRQLLDDDLGKRIWGIARGIVPEREDVDKIAASACARLVTFVMGPYFNVVAQRIERKPPGAAAPESLTGRDIADIRQELDAATLQGSGRLRGSRTPLVVLEKRLEIVYGTDQHKPQEMLVYGYSTHLQYKPDEIVSDFGVMPLPRLARTLFNRYMAMVGENARSRLEPKFSSLLRLADSKEREPPLAKLWDPCHTVERWVERVRNESGMKRGGPTSDPELLAKVAAQPAQRRIAWLLTDLLDHDPARIVSEHGDRTLEQLTVWFTEVYARASGISIEEARRRFEPTLRLGKESSTELRAYFDPRRTVADWTCNVTKRIRRTETAEGQEGLRILFEAFGGYEPYQILAFLFTQCLGWRAERLAQEARWEKAGGTAPEDQRPVTLKDLRRKLEEAFCATFDANATEKQAISSWFTPLGNRLLPFADQSLSDCGTRDHPVAPLAARIANWRAELLKAVPPSLTGGEAASMFAWRYNLLKSAEDAVWMEP